MDHSCDINCAFQSMWKFEEFLQSTFKFLNLFLCNLRIFVRGQELTKAIVTCTRSSQLTLWMEDEEAHEIMPLTKKLLTGDGS